MNVGYVFRHGYAGEGVSKLAHGTGEDHLNAEGRQQAQELAAKAPSLGITSLRSSDLPRARETAEVIGKAIGIKPFFTRGLRTIDIGKKVSAMDEKQARPLIARLTADEPDTKFPGGQSHAEWVRQVWPELRLFMLRIQAGQKPAIVVHGRLSNLLQAFVAAKERGFSKAVLREKPQQKHGTIWKMGYDGNRFSFGE